MYDFLKATLLDEAVQSLSMRIFLLMCLALPAWGTDVRQMIIGGQPASICDHPHQLALRDYRGQFACGAVLLAPTRALTAAHCVPDSVHNYSMLGGTNNRETKDKSCNIRGSTCVTRNLTLIRKHLKYNPQAFVNDIAIIGFDRVEYNTNLKPISLYGMSDGYPKAGDLCTITGWGRTQSNISTLPIILQQSEVIVWSTADCKKVWPGLNINEWKVCITTAHGGSSACQGDSGSPLVCNNKLAGVTSWGEPKCNPQKPQVYTNVVAYMEWIDKNFLK